MAADPIGHHDEATCSLIRGWVCDPDNYSAPVTVHFYVDGPAGQGGSYVDQTTASITREAAVGQMCGGYRAHGFSWRVPQSLRNGATRSIYAHAINIGGGSNPVILDSGRAIQCSGSGTETSLYVQPALYSSSLIAQRVVATSQAAPLSPPVIPHNQTYLVFWRMKSLSLTTVSGDISAYTGFPYSYYQRGVANSVPVTSVQWYGNSVGMLNVPSTSPHTGTIMPITLHHTFSPASLRPWPSSQYELSYKVDLKVPYSSSPTSHGVINYAQGYVAVLDATTNKWMWIGGTIFDTRAYSSFPNNIGLETDPANPSTANPIINSSLRDYMSYSHMDALSAYASNTTWSAYKTFDFRVSYGELQQAITEIRAMYPSTHGNLSLLPENYRLYGVFFLSEVYHASEAVPDGKLGLSLRNLRVSTMRNPAGF